MNFPDLSKPQTMRLLISFFDISGFTVWSKGKKSEELFDYMLTLSKVTADTVEKAGGHVIKYIGDSALIVFKEEDAEKGIFCLMDLQNSIADILEKAGMPGKAAFSCHVGTTTVGILPPIQQPDIMGDDVNLAFILLRKRGKGAFVLSPQAFRSLSPEGRKRFRKYSEPYVYLAN